jgi:hypothetical protein
VTDASPEHREARALAIAALTSSASESDVAAELEAAAEKAAALPPGYGPPEVLRQGYYAALRVVAQLCRWEAAVRGAEPDAGRFLAAAQRNAEHALDGLDSDDDAHAGLRSVLRAVASVTGGSDVADVRARLATVPVPMQMVASPTARQADRALLMRLRPSREPSVS